MYRDWDGCTYTRGELEEAYRDEVREAILYGEPYCSWEEYLETFEEVEEDVEEVKAMMYVDAWKNGDRR